MTLDEAQDLVATIATICPGQPKSELAAEGWHLVLDDIDYRQAVAAVRHIARSADTRPLFIDPRQVLNQVRRERAARLDHAELVGAPSDPDDYRAWLREARRAAADGKPAPAPAIPPPSSPAEPGKRRAQLQRATTSVARATRP